MTDYIICDLPYTLLDARHREIPTGHYLTTLEKDTVNYSCLMLLKAIKGKSKVIFTHYALSRLHSKVQEHLKRLNIAQYGELITNFNTQEVHDDTTLKAFVYNQLIRDGHTVKFAIDNEKKTETMWLNNEVALIQVPQGII